MQAVTFCPDFGEWSRVLRLDIPGCFHRISLIKFVINMIQPNVSFNPPSAVRLLYFPRSWSHASEFTADPISHRNLFAVQNVSACVV